ncbi:MAG: hypothetical protein H6Q32_567, partial [Bacteroidetes bacterium]|nr:hypothetical protein [Bacteroidota bacterium]
MIDPLTPDFSRTPATEGRPRFEYVRADLTEAPGVTIVTPYFNTGALFHETA